MKDIITFMKIVKYMMLATITFCVVYIAMWFQHYESMVL